MEYTKAQRQAIGLRDCSLLVSAGAGSGKTAVLTERIIERLCDADDGCDITDFLIVTFTNAAAKELSDRIKRKLSEAAAKEPSNKKILRNIALLPLAKISTINAFCYDTVKKNFQKLGLSPAVRIADDAEMTVLKNRVMNELIETVFENSEEKEFKRFIDVYETYSGAKNDNAFVSLLLSLYDKIRNEVNPEGFMDYAVELYEEAAVNPVFFESKYGALLKKHTSDTVNAQIELLEKLREMCIDSDQLEKKYVPGIEEDIDRAKSLLICLEKGYESTRTALLKYELSKLSAVRNYPNPTLCEMVREARKQAVDKIRGDLAELYSADERTLRLCARDSIEVLKELFSLISRFSSRLSEVKNELGIVDFNDVEHYTLSLLCTDGGEPTETALEMRRRYKEIYIDEYQDVNPLQDMIFKVLSQTDENGREKSRFMVGDIKQSIYRFRGARPDIFKAYRDEFCPTDSDFPTKKIFMSDNFRCAKSVINLTNQLFSRLMGGDFETGDFLLFSRCEEKPVRSKALLSILDIDKSSDAETSAEEYEARFIGQKILGIVQNPLYTSSSGKTFDFSDVAVLTRSKNALKIYESVLTEMGIPVYSDVGEGFYGKKEILLALCILNSIDNPKRDIYLAGFMRSAPGGFTDDELCVIRQADKKDGLYAALNRYSQSGTDALLAEKCAAFIETLGEYRRLSRGKNAAELLWEIYTRMDLLNLCASPSFNADSAQQCADRRKNLLKLYEIARNYTKTSFRGVGAFIEYINGSMENTDEKADRLLGDDCVRLMTIHSSKGLEFPVCFVSDLARRFNRSDEREKTVFSDSAGIGLKLRDVEGLLSQTSSTGRTVIDTPFRKLVGGCEAEKGLSEEMRILYVALTRARDYLFMTAAVKTDVCKSFKRAYVNCATGGFSNAQSYMEAILNCVISDECASAYRSRAELDALNGVCGDAFNGCLECELLLSDYLELDVLNTQAQAAGCPDNGQIDIQVYNVLKERGAFEYSGEVFTKIPSKLTVSQLKKGLIDEDGKALSEAKRDLKKIPDFCLGEKAPGGAERGTAMHLFMQFADYERCENGGCAAEADRLFADGFIDGRTRALLDLPTLDGFFATELYGQVKKSKHVYRERRFNLEQDAGDYTDEAQRGIRNVLVQGVIDLYFENGDGTYTVVDFKTDAVGEQDGESVLKQRHSAQLLYYCRAVEEITGCRVSEAQLFSFALMRGVSVEV